MVTDPTPEQEALAEALVAEAVEGYEHLLSAEMLDVIKCVLESELLGTEDGQRMLRQCQADPSVERSGDLAKVPAEQKAKASGEG